MANSIGKGQDCSQQPLCSRHFGAERGGEGGGEGSAKAASHAPPPPPKGRRSEGDHPFRAVHSLRIMGLKDILRKGHCLREPEVSPAVNPAAYPFDAAAYDKFGEVKRYNRAGLRRRVYIGIKLNIAAIFDKEHGLEHVVNLDRCRLYPLVQVSVLHGSRASPIHAHGFLFFFLSRNTHAPGAAGERPTAGGYWTTVVD